MLSTPLFFQKELAGPLRPESSSPAASLSTPVSNVAHNTLAVSVPLKPSQPVSEIRVKEEELLLRVLHSPPVTPVKADRLEYFLQGYDMALTHYLIDGFRFGFRVHFVGERRAYDSPNLKSALDKPDITSEKLRKE